jgi:hypothetical protein
MPEHIRALVVRTALYSAAAMGVLGALVLGFVGLRAGDHGELERILAIACFAMAAGSLLGVRTDDGIADARRPSGLPLGDKVMMVVAAPLVLGCLAVLWRPIFGEPARATIAPELERPRVPQPAYA